MDIITALLRYYNYRFLEIYHNTFLSSFHSVFLSIIAELNFREECLRNIIHRNLFESGVLEVSLANLQLIKIKSFSVICYDRLVNPTLTNIKKYQLLCDQIFPGQLPHFLLYSSIPSGFEIKSK